MMGIDYLFEDQCHNTLMKMRTTVVNIDNYRPPVSYFQKLSDSTMDSNKRAPETHGAECQDSVVVVFHHFKLLIEDWMTWDILSLSLLSWSIS